MKFENLNYYPIEFITIIHSLKVNNILLKNTHLKDETISHDGYIELSAEEFDDIKRYLNRKVDINDIKTKRIENVNYLEKFRNKYIVVYEDLTNSR